ncbi:alkyl sulfatase [Mycobacterium pseudoshottsii JCM 15466]|nr:Alkyl sulfatase [Mycobacterium pseudoshottsii]GAQ33392.1 alkyl sulfatase [Mycobacterium pseudoshottsii JCM 15466]
MEQTSPSPFIVSNHRDHLSALPFGDTQDFTAADRGFIAKLSPCVVTAADGRVVWDNDSYSFLDEDAPPSVHPSLWRQSQLCAKQGLYQVVEGIYQVRGLDLSNISFIEGDAGVIVIDPLVCTETAAAALALYRGDRAVSAVIYTHSHVDHFGGVFGVTTQADVDAGKVAVLAPEGFVEHAVQENVYAGTAMARRAAYMYGAVLPRGPQGQVGCGLGQTPSLGEVGLIVPTIDITSTGEIHTIDGVDIEFQMAPGTEAPAEMHFYFPKFRALCMAENATHNLHNLLTLRGALVRDPHAWSGYLTEAIDTFADRTDVVFASHHWPTWAARASWNSSRCNGIYTPTCTIRRCACSTRDTPVSRSRKTSGCPRRWRRPGTPMATTDRSTTTSRPSTSVTWAGSTAIPPGSGSTRPKRSGPDTSRPSAASTAPSNWPRRPTTPATTVGLQHFLITLCSPTSSTPARASRTRTP